MAELSSRDVWRVPGLLSLARVPLGGVFARVSSNPTAAMVVLSVAAATDVADGWYARRFAQESPMGRVLDPVTDKFFVTTVVVVLIGSGKLSVGEAVLLGMRELCELAIVAVWAVERRPRPVRAANHLGKWVTVMQFVSVAAILFGSRHRRSLVLATAGCGLVSGLSYGIREWRGRNHPRSVS